MAVQEQPFLLSPLPQGANWLRYCKVTGPTTFEGGGDEQLTIQFRIEQWHSGTPGIACIEVLNPSRATAAKWKDVENQPIALEAGYKSHYGLIFSGQIKQTIYSHDDDNVTTRLQIFAADGDMSYRKAIVTKTLPRGWTPQRRLEVALEFMAPFGVTMGRNTLDLSKPVYPRGFPMIGMARQHLREIAHSAGGLWSVQMGKLTMTGKDLDDGNSAVVDLTPASGLVSYPRQTADGVEFRCLLDATIQPLTKVKLDPSLIVAAQKNNNELDPNQLTANQQLTDAQISAGQYTVYKVSRSGNTRGQNWYNDCVCIGKGGILPKSASDQYYSLGSQ